MKPNEFDRMEIVRNDRVVWQSDKAKKYLCPTCDRWVPSQYGGEALPTVHCEAIQHRLVWGER